METNGSSTAEISRTGSFLADLQMATKDRSTAERSRTSHNELHQNIRRVYADLTRSLTKHEVTSITDKLYSRSIILMSECEHILASSTHIKSAQALCDIILKKDEFACEIFLKALREISKDVLADLIWNKTSTLDKRRFFENLEQQERAPMIELQEKETILRKQPADQKLQMQNKREELYKQQKQGFESIKALARPRASSPAWLTATVWAPELSPRYFPLSRRIISATTDHRSAATDHEHAGEGVQRHGSSLASLPATATAAGQSPRYFSHSRRTTSATTGQRLAAGDSGILIDLEPSRENLEQQKRAPRKELQEKETILRRQPADKKLQMQNEREELYKQQKQGFESIKALKRPRASSPAWLTAAASAPELSPRHFLLSRRIISATTDHRSAATDHEHAGEGVQRHGSSPASLPTTVTAAGQSPTHFSLSRRRTSATTERGLADRDSGILIDLEPSRESIEAMEEPRSSPEECTLVSASRKSRMTFLRSQMRTSETTEQSSAATDFGRPSAASFSDVSEATADVVQPEKRSPPSASYLAISTGSAIADLSLDSETRVDVKPSGVITILGAESKSPASQPHADERVRSNRTVSPPELYELMQKLMQKLGKFSYYITTDMDFIVRQEHPASTEFNFFESQVADFLKEPLGSVYKLFVFPEPAGALCAAYEGSIGSRIYTCMSESIQWSQVLGMYLLYENVIYWVTTAHGLLLAMPSARNEYSNEDLGRNVFRERQSTETLPVVYMYSSLHSSISPPISKIKLPVIYPCFVHETYPHQRLGCNTKLLHTIDIMIGALPFTLYDLTDPEEIHRLSSAGIMCECRVCQEHNERQELCPTCITSIANFPEKVSSSEQNKYAYYDLSALEDPDVELCCRLSQCNKLAKGKIRSVNSSGIVLKVVEEKTANNVIIIEPHHSNRSCDSPAQGHSGSIWYQDKGHTREAVAVTIGTMDDEKRHGKRLWLAVPLCASLYALSKEYPNTFGDPKLFKPLSCFGCHRHPRR